MNTTSSLNELIATIEAELRHVYQLNHQISALDHLVAQDALADIGQSSDHSCVLLRQAQAGELEIALYLPKDLHSQLAKASPLKILDNHNLHAYSVLVEELSHFHLLIHRALTNSFTTQLELEWQGEVDKVLFSATRLKEQIGHPHYHHLARKFFDEAKIFAADYHRYWEATRFAAQFWYQTLTYLDGIYDPLNSAKLHQHLRLFHRKSWGDKLQAIQQQQNQVEWKIAV